MSLTLKCLFAINMYPLYEINFKSFVYTFRYSSRHCRYFLMLISPIIIILAHVPKLCKYIYEDDHFIWMACRSSFLTDSFFHSFKQNIYFKVTKDRLFGDCERKVCKIKKSTDTQSLEDIFCCIGERRDKKNVRFSY